jgi:hypothetical protein
MEARIALVISIIGLAVTIIAQRDKLLSFLDELKAWRVEKGEKKKALALVAKLAATETRDLSSIAIYLLMFFLSVISSAILSFYERQPTFVGALTFSAAIYSTISMIVIAIFLLVYRRLKIRFILDLFIAAGLIGTF